jgi:kynurenine formamidase
MLGPRADVDVVAATSYAGRMRLRLHEATRVFDVDIDSAIDLSMPVEFDHAAGRAFSLGPARTAAVQGGTFVGDVRRGGSCNCETHTLTPHGDGTHTEGPGHLLASRVAVRVPACFLLAAVVRVQPRLLGESEDEVAGNHRNDDLVVDRALLEDALSALDQHGLLPRALVVATASGEVRRAQRFSGTNPPYFTHDAARFVRERGFDHLVVDLPSIDREDDGGLLSAHRAFFGLPPGVVDVDGPLAPRTITELAAVNDDVLAGMYALALQVAPLDADAAPSRPLLCPLLPVVCP